MAGTIPENVAGTRDRYWRERIAAQERSGLSVQQFCKEQGLNNPLFYYWRKRLRQQTPVRFALSTPLRPEEELATTEAKDDTVIGSRLEAESVQQTNAKALVVYAQQGATRRKSRFRLILYRVDRNRLSLSLSLSLSLRKKE